MTNIKIRIRYPSLNYVELVNSSSLSDSEKLVVISFFDELKLGKLTGNQPTDDTIRHYFCYLIPALKFFEKPSSEIVLSDVDRFCSALLLNRFQKFKQGSKRTVKINYTEVGKIKLKNTLALFLKWRLQDKSFKMIEQLRLKPKRKRQTVDYLKEPEIVKLFKGAKTAEEKFLVAVLFDSGARAEEFHNIRFEDIEMPKGDKSFVKITLKEEYSKTNGRTISLYWKYTLEAVQDYLEQRMKEGIKPNEPIYNHKYRASSGILERLGNRVLGRHIHYHLFRHSSATHYASEMNRQQLCIRYGWAFSSPMPDVYISRKGLGELEAVNEKFESINSSKIKAENEELKTKMGKIEEKEKIVKLTLEQMQKQMQEQQKQMQLQQKELDEIKSGKRTYDKEFGVYYVEPDSPNEPVYNEPESPVNDNFNPSSKNHGNKK